MKIVVIASQKGGAGKTMLTAHLAVMAEENGDGPCAVADTDRQGSLADWWNERQAQSPAFVKVHPATLTADIEAVKKAGFKLLFIDTPPVVTDVIRGVVSAADLVVIPARPSPVDLRAVGATIEIVEGESKNMVFVINGATPRANITGEAAISLSQHGKVAPVTMHQRTDFASSFTDGRTAQEIAPNGNSAKEVERLWSYLRGLLKLKKRKDGNIEGGV